MRTAFTRSLALLLALLLLPCLTAADGESWVCPVCANTCTGNFCNNCGAKRPEAASAYAVGDIVTFGRWGGESIDWQVLADRGDGSYTLMSVPGLDAVPYHTSAEDVTWAESSVRAWLNGAFFEEAFTEDEKRHIELSRVVNADNAVYGTPGGPDTEDMVYLLSLEELGTYFGVDAYGETGAEALICLPTKTAADNGAYVLSRALAESMQRDYSYPLREGACWWWLRSPGESGGFKANVINDGTVFCSGTKLTVTVGCVRPVICLRPDTAAAAPVKKQPEPAPVKGVYRVGDTVTAGYWDGEPVTWQIVADKGDGTYVLLSTEALEPLPYQNVGNTATWEECSVREWLNGTFYESAFSETERGRIHRARTGGSTDDYVFLLSPEEVGRYFGVDPYGQGRSEALICMPSAGALSRGAYTYSRESVESAQPNYDYPLREGACCWWLRKESGAAYVSCTGIVMDERLVYMADVCVRPAILMELDPAAAPGGPERPAEGKKPVEPDKPTEPVKPAPPTPGKGGYAAGDTVKLGSWDREEIEWTVLEAEGDGVYVLMSVKGLVPVPYNVENTDIKWEDASLRRWLNTTFYDNAFSFADQECILVTHSINPDNPVTGVSGGGDTENNVYLLSYAELERFFGTDIGRSGGCEALVCLPARTAAINGAAELTKEQIAEAQPAYGFALTEGAGMWWLRTPGSNDRSALRVNAFGEVESAPVDSADTCIRPVIRARLA